MKEFRDTYIKEADGLILRLSEKIAVLDKNHQNEDVLYEVFRAVHSLKGGGAMFGFAGSSEFAGKLEEKYEKVKDKEKELSQELIDITYKSIEHLKNLMKQEPEDNPEIKKIHEKLLEEIEKII